jgi:hypothetical protein
MNDNLDVILSNQKIVPPSTNLSARIIAAAAIKKNTPFWMIVMQEVSAMLYIPRPAYALAFSVILGVVLGLQGEVEQMISAQDQAQDLFSFIQVETDWTEGNWL